MSKRIDVSNSVLRQIFNFQINTKQKADQVMGSMGLGAFENDHALDWADDLERSKKPLAFIEKTLTECLKSTDDSYECERALAAAEVVAALQGNASRQLPDNLKEWLVSRTEQLTDQFRIKAIEVCQKILEDSELKELHGNDAAWRKSVKQIMARVEKPTKPRKIANPAKRSTNSAVQDAIKVVKSKGGHVSFEQRVPVIVAMDKNADIDFFKSVGELTSLRNFMLGNTKKPIPPGAFSYLSPLKKLIDLSLNRARISDEHLSVVADLPELITVELESTNITDEALKYFKECRKLIQLHLNDTQVTDRGIGCLAALSELKLLALEGTGITDGGFEHLKKIQNLQTIDLSNTAVTGARLKVLSELQKLSVLDLMRSKLTDKGLSTLSHPKIEILRLGRTPIQGRGLSALAHLPLLSTLDLSGCPLQDVHCKHLPSAPLVELRLEDCPITDKAVAHIADCSRLEKLLLSGTGVTDAGTVELCRLKSLRVLWLERTKISDETLESIATESNITHLNLAETAITFAGLEKFIGNKHIQHIDVRGCDLAYKQVSKVFQKIRASQPKGKQVFCC